MNPKDVRPAELRGKMAAGPNVRCTMQSAHPAGNPARFRSSPGTIALYIAAIAFPDKDNSSRLKVRPSGRIFISDFFRGSIVWFGKLTGALNGRI